MKLNILESIVREIGADSAAIMAPDKANGHLFCYTSFNMPQEWVGIKNSFDEDTPGGNVEAYKTGQAIITNYLQKMLEGYYIESIMVVPIKRGEDIVATLEVIHDRANETFTKGDLQIVQQFADKLATKLVL
ncbi:MAG: GAF domain-containing protein [Candidatus Saccharimonadales bacterium]